MAKILPKGKKVAGTKKKDKIVSTGKGVWKKALTVYAGNGNDVINFKKSNYRNTLNGQNGNDTIYGGKKNDKITGGKGNDKIYTGKGTSTLIINKGDGNDTIYHQGKKTTIKVNKANSNDTQKFEKNGNDLLLTYTHAGTTVNEVLIIKDYFVGNKNIFLGTQKLDDLINAKGLAINGSGTLTGTNYNDTITGSNGNDVLDGGNGNDTLNGGKGNDKIYTGTGNNIVRLNSGDGVDILYKGSGSDTLLFDNFVNLTELKYNINAEKSDNDLKLFYTAKDCIVLKDFFKSGTSVKSLSDKAGNKLDFNSYMSGVKFDIAGNEMEPSTISGTNYNDVIRAGFAGDVIYGNGGNDKIFGGSGNDTIYGGDGNDTILDNRGGYNEIYGGNGDDIITTDTGAYLVDVGSGDNYINLLGNGYVTLSGGDGDNTVITTDTSKQITLGNGDNYLKLYKGYTDVKLGDGNNEVNYNNAGGSDFFRTEAGNGTNRIQVGNEGNYSSASYAEATVGNGNNNDIGLYTSGHGEINVGDGSGNRINARGQASSIYIYVGNGDSNYIEVIAPSAQIIRIGNGSNNEITVEGNAYAQIYTGEDADGNLLDSNKVGSNYIYAGYKDTSTCTQTCIHSGGNDTICTVGTADILLRNSNSSKTICTNFTAANGGEDSIMRVSYDSSNGFTGGLQIQLQDNISSFMPYYSLINNDYGNYDLRFAALDAEGNVLDNSIYLYDAFTSEGALYGSYIFKFDADKFFVDSSNNYHSLSEYTQIYNMTTGTFRTTELPYYRSDKLIINSTNGNDSLTLVGGETVNLKGSASSKIMNVNPDYSGTEVNINGVMNVAETVLSFNNQDIKDFVFSHYYSSYNNLDDDGNGTGYIKIYGRDKDGNILGEGSKIYGTWNNYYLDLDSDVIGGHGSDGVADIDNLLKLYNLRTIYKVSDMTQYVDMAIYDENVWFDVESAGYNLYNIGSGNYFVQGSEKDDSYWWEFAGKVTINEKSGNDTLTIYAGYDSVNHRMGYENVKFLFDVSVTRDGDNNIISTSVGDDLIFAADFYGNSEFDKLFSTNIGTRNSVTTLTVKDYFCTNGSSMDTIKTNYQIGTDIFYDTLDYEALTSSVDNNEILQAVTAWLGNHTDYSSVMDAINNCTDQTALNQLAQCYSNSNYFDNYWIS